ncbi:DUF7509 family protein [Halorussus halobius]|uniref:DUF7509 family protein n=1 Tax=Halorussus halobius TaxID=1710537 RepID=UPI001091B1C0|nr:hypothetical protein [Halorussus halobius]
MNGRDYDEFRYDGRPVFEYVRRDAPTPDRDRLDEDFFVYVMGPYTAFDATYVFDDAEKLRTSFIDDPLFDPDRHVTGDETGTMEAALRDVCEEMRELFGVRAFLATDIDVPTRREAEERDLDNYLSVLDQSVAFAAVSDAVVFVFTQAGLTTGAGSEVGAILSEFNLRTGNPEPDRKPRERFRVFRGESFGSASIDELPYTYGVDAIEFEDEADLLAKTRQFLANVERTARDRPFPVYTSYEA